MSTAMILSPIEWAKLPPNRSSRLTNGPEDVVDSFARLQSHFVECIRTGMNPLTHGEDNLKTLELVFAAYRSAEEDRAIEISPGE